MKKINYRKLLMVMAWALVSSGLVVSLGFVSKSERRIIASDLNILISNNNENAFISENDVKAFFNERERPVLSRRYESISIRELENSLNAHPAVQNAEVSADLNGQLKVSITQRTPVLRVINADGESYYIDSESRLMPLNENYSARVLVASGDIHEPYARRFQYTVEQIRDNKIFSEASLLDDLMEVTDYILADSALAGLIHQLHVTREKEIELFPAVGNHKIVFGEAKDVAEKFNKLKLFYTEGLNKSDRWNSYSAISLKYKNLVVCTRK